MKIKTKKCNKVYSLILLYVLLFASNLNYIFTYNFRIFIMYLNKTIKVCKIYWITIYRYRLSAFHDYLFNQLLLSNILKCICRQLRQNSQLLDVAWEMLHRRCFTLQQLICNLALGIGPLTLNIVLLQMDCRFSLSDSCSSLSERFLTPLVLN